MFFCLADVLNRNIWCNVHQCFFRRFIARSNGKTKSAKNQQEKAHATQYVHEKNSIASFIL